MKIGMVADSLAHLGFNEMLDASAELGLSGIEVATGNWSSAPHCDLAKLLGDTGARTAFAKAFADRGLELFALNANGNQLHPTDGARQSGVLHDTIRLAGLLGVETIVCMSGLPGGGPGEKTPNWIVSSWPPETGEILNWQWDKVLLPYWHDLVKLAEANNVRIAIEIHGNQIVYNPVALLRLRNEVGPVIGANLDPSHMMWMGGDPLQAIDLLGDATYHVHAKDTYINPSKVGVQTRLENGQQPDLIDRAWGYITLGYGNDERWWREFCYRLRMAGYDGWLSIEHEDVMLSRVEGVRKSIELLRNVAPSDPSDYSAPAI